MIRSCRLYLVIKTLSDSCTKTPSRWPQLRHPRGLTTCLKSGGLQWKKVCKYSEHSNDCIQHSRYTFRLVVVLVEENVAFSRAVSTRALCLASTFLAYIWYLLC